MGLHRFVQRAPRYVLQPNDRQIVRYAPERGPRAASLHQTRLLNISETGMGILVEHHASPHIGERIKIELPVPGGEQIAWWATVVRVEKLGDNWWAPKNEFDYDSVIVGLQFEDLPEGHRRAIRRGLEIRFVEELRERRRQHWLFLREFWKSHAMQWIAYAVLTACAAGLLYWLSRPSANYDPKYGAPWGQRYKWLNFDDDSK